MLVHSTDMTDLFIVSFKRVNIPVTKNLLDGLGIIEKNERNTFKNRKGNKHIYRKETP